MTASPLRQALDSSRSSLVAIAWISAVINILLLIGPLYLMLIYNSVMPSGSGATLIGLFALVLLAYVFQGAFDLFRLRLLADTAASFDERLSLPVYRSMLGTAQGAGSRGDPGAVIRNLDAVRTFLASAGPPALIDLPWIALFLVLLFLLHPWLGVVALLGALVLAGVTLINDRMGRAPGETAAGARSDRGRILRESIQHAELFRALGMQRHFEDRWAAANSAFNRALDRSSRLTGGFASGSRVFRMLLQSIMLTVGAALYVAGEASGGIVFASSFLAARALAPVDQAIANWRGFIEARRGWRELEATLESEDNTQATTLLERPAATLEVQGLTVAPPGTERPVLEKITFALEAGDAVGVIGPTAAGKTSLARAVLGLWPASEGTVRLDGAELSQWTPDVLGSFVGYLPQQVELIEGTIAQNIARMDPAAPSEAVIAAARTAGAHEMIVAMENGYDTPIGAGGALLAGGQRQRVGLARALYGDPFLVVLDEPNSNLDTPGDSALDQAIVALRARGAIVVLIAHRPSALRHVNKVLLLENGKVSAFGTREEILPRVLPGGVSPIQQAAAPKGATVTSKVAP